MASSLTVNRSSTALADDGEGALAGPLDGDAVGNGAGARPIQLARAERSRERRAAIRLHAVHAHARAQVTRGRRHARDQPAAADRHHEGIEILDILQQLERDHTLASHDRRVVEGVHVVQPAFVGHPHRDGVGLVVRGALQHDLGAVALNGGHLGQRRADRQHDRRRHAEQARRQRHALAVVAGRCGQHAARRAAAAASPATWRARRES